MKFDTYKDLGLPTPLQAALDKMKFINPTPVQAATIPVAMAGQDVLATAQTGTGKTGAFGIPMLHQLIVEPTKQALILAPTRELAAQIFSVLRQIGAGSKKWGALVVGGESFYRQVGELKRGVDYIVATPGRLTDHLQEGTVDLSCVNILVFDEVDRMLDMGFAPQIQQILRYVPKERQTLLFSATLPKEIEDLARKFQKDPVRVSIGHTFKPAEEVTQETIRTTQEQKSTLILGALQEREGKVIVFARTQSRTERLAKFLAREGHQVVSLHGGKTQSQRKYALEMFRTGSHRIMVATDLAGRGIDVADIEHVINFDVPATREDYIHRIGRTGRCGKEGKALNLLTSEDADGEFVVTGERPKRGAGGPSSGAPRSGGPKRGRRPFGRRFGGPRSGQGGAQGGHGGRDSRRPSRPAFGERREGRVQRG